MKKKGLKSIIKDLLKENEIPRVKPSWDAKKGLKSNLPKPTATNKPKVKEASHFRKSPSKVTPLNAMDVKSLIIKELEHWQIWDNPVDRKEIINTINSVGSINDLAETINGLGFEDPLEFIMKSITKMR